MNRMLIPLGGLLSAALLLSGCSLAPKYERPALPVADAFPDEEFEGTVRTVALEAEFTPRNIQTRTDRDRLVYPVEVIVVNRDGKLRAGMPVQVTLPGTER